MILRKNRTHLSGSSNLSTQSEHIRPSTQPGQSRLAFLSLAKNKQTDDTFETKPIRAVATPFDKTRSFYETHGKSERLRTQVGSSRAFQLEDPAKMKMPFTGESHLVWNKNMDKYRRDDSPMLIPNKDTLNKELLAKEKHEIHAIAIQETQLVGYDKYSAETLKNNVNLEKVREAKRVLRRKYGNRVNMYRIYSAWDADHKGRISIDNFYSMAKKLGLNLNYDEARVLLASADKSGKGNLNLDEFFDLVNNKDDALNVDLDNLSRHIDSNYLLQKERLENEDDNVIKKLEENAKKARDTKHMNQVNLILKNKLQEISLSFGLVDTYKKGYTTFDQFEQNIKKLRVDEKLISDKDIKVLFNKYSKDSHTANYKNFLDDLKNFNFYHDEAYKEYENPSSMRELAKNYASEPVVVKKQDDINIVDCRTLPYSTVYTYLGKKRRISRLIQKFFPRKEDLKTYFAQTLKISTDDTETHLLSKNEAKDAILNLFKKFDISNLTNRDFEGFLSSFIYNKQNYTKMNDILNGVYEEDEDALIHKIHKREKGPPPHRSEDIHPEDNFEENPENKSIRMDFFNKENSNGRINEILKKVDDRIFIGRKKAYDLYKMFDVDKDGFISRTDFTKKAVEMSLVPKEDLPVLLDYLDSSNKGYVNFKEFHQKIRSNATQQDVRGEPTVFPFVVPSKESFERVTRFVPETKKKLDEIISTYQPDNYSTLRPASRFGQAPAWKNTFLHIQPNVVSPMFITERERFIRTPNAQVLPTTEDKEKRKRIQSAKIELIKQNNELISRRAEQDMLKHDLLDQNRLKTKLQAVTTHEYNARMRNDFF